MPTDTSDARPSHSPRRVGVLAAFSGIFVKACIGGLLASIAASAVVFALAL
jgi:hypothetical protein